MTIIPVTQGQEFLKFLNTTIDTTDYRYKYLMGILDLAFGSGQAEVTENTAVYQDGDDWIIYIETEGQLFLYGSENEELLAELSNKTDLKNFHGYEIMGEYNLVYSFLKKQKINNYTVIKDRVFYQLSDPKKLLPPLQNTIPNEADAEELTQMMLDYYHEEYEGTRDKQYEPIFEGIIKYIMTNRIYVYKEEKIIKAFCTIIDPDIGIIYTKPEFRKKQIGKKLLSTCSRLLLEPNEACYLMTDLNNLASNKMMRDLGYDEIYKHSNLRI